jgi:hypothetical protein
VEAVAEAYGRQFTVECVTEMHLTCSIPINDMHNLRLCLECSWENPAQLDMEDLIALDNQSAILAEVTEARKGCFLGYGVVSAQADRHEGPETIRPQFFSTTTELQNKGDSPVHAQLLPRHHNQAFQN